MTVLLVGNYYGHEFDLLAEEVERRGEEAIVVDTDDWPSQEPLTYDVADGHVQIGDHEIDPESVDGVFVRQNGVFVPVVEDHTRGLVSEDDNPYAALTQLREYRGLFWSILRRLADAGATIAPCLEAREWQEAGVHSLRTLSEAGVPVPETLATGDPAAATEFLERHGRVVCKPIAEFGGVQLMDADDADRLESLTTPVLFQALVPGDDVRAYVVDGEFLGAFRYVSDVEGFSFKQGEEDPDGEPVDLSDAAVEDVKAAVGATPMDYAAVDLRYTDERDHTILEVNAGGRFMFADSRELVEVTTPLTDYLLGE
jgi:glutathione synthase/RimK-type ligase-like ATP-grasp enzyme